MTFAATAIRLAAPLLLTATLAGCAIPYDQNSYDSRPYYGGNAYSAPSYGGSYYGGDAYPAYSPRRHRSHRHDRRHGDGDLRHHRRAQERPGTVERHRRDRAEPLGEERGAAERRRRTARRRSIHGPTLLLLTASLLSVNSIAVGQEKPPGDSGNEAGKATASLSDFPAMRVPPAEPAGSLADSPEVRELYDAALEALEDGKPRRAIDKLDQALELADENYYEVFHLMARAKFSLKRFGEARTAADLAVRLRNGAADTHYLLGRLYRRRDDLERAIGHFRTATLAAEREVNNANISAAFFELGECLMETGYTQAAAESFQQFDERIFDSHPEHRNHERIAAALKRYPRGMIGVRTELLKKLGRTDDVVRAAEWAAGSRPEDDYLARMHIRALLDARRYAEAFEASSSVLKAAADLNDSYVGLAVEAAVGAKRLEYWVDELAAGLSADSKSGLASSVARHLDAAGAAEAAIKLWRALAAQDPKDAARTWYLAASLRAAGRLRETVEALVEYVRGNPESVEVPRQQFAAWMRPFDASDELLGLVDAFSDDVQAKLLRHCKYCRADGRIIRVGMKVLYERPVNLECIDWESLEVTQ